MARKNWKLAAVAAMLAVVATACGSNTPSANGLEGEVTLWHAYGSSGGSAEGTAFADQLAKFEKEFPKIKITAVEVPFSDIFTKFKTEAAAGGGPDLFIAPNDELGNLVTAGLLEPITDTTDLGTISQQALDGATIGGKLYLVPESLKAVVMYYDSAKIATPPATAAEFKDYVDNGGKVAVPAGVYHVWGWYKAFGASIFDSTGHAACFTTPVGDAMDYVKSLKAAGAVVDGNDGDLGQKYMNGEVDVMFNGVSGSLGEGAFNEAADVARDGREIANGWGGHGAGKRRAKHTYATIVRHSTSSSRQRISPNSIAPVIHDGAS